MSNKKIAECFIATRGAKDCKGSNFYVSRGVLYSYGPHFPLALFRGGVLYINSDGYSQSTARHKSYVTRAAGNYQSADTARMRELAGTKNESYSLKTCGVD